MAGRKTDAENAKAYRERQASLPFLERHGLGHLSGPRISRFVKDHQKAMAAAQAATNDLNRELIAAVSELPETSPGREAALADLKRNARITFLKA